MAPALHLRTLRLLESVSYSPPSSPAAVMADFYMLAWLGTVDPRGYVDRDPSAVRLDLEDVRHAQSVLLPKLREELLHDLYFAMCCEIRHMLRAVNVEAHMTPFLWSYYRNFKAFSGPFTDPRYGGTHRPNEPDVIPAKSVHNITGNRGYEDSYRAVNRAAKKHGLTREGVVKEMRGAFRSMNWEDKYGGEAWGAIADGWLLLGASSTRDHDAMTVAIDHAYDLQHHTGSVFNKLKRYYMLPPIDGSVHTHSPGFSWIKEALDFKANLKSMKELLPRCSSQMRKLARPVLRFLPDATPEGLGLGVSVEPPEPPEPAPEEVPNTQPVHGGMFHGVWKGTMHWKWGTFSGVWEKGTWENGTWHGGTWHHGTWKAGTWHDGTWKSGLWEFGLWAGGRWETGLWKGGTWLGGTWMDGTWEKGTWKDGVWKDGVWNGGTWKDGTWLGGTWNGGTWEGGSVYHNGFAHQSSVDPPTFFANLAQSEGGGSVGESLSESLSSLVQDVADSLGAPALMLKAVKEIWPHLRWLETPSRRKVAAGLKDLSTSLQKPVEDIVHEIGGCCSDLSLLPDA